MTLKRYQVLYHAEVVSELQFFEDHVLMQSEQSKEHIELQYAQIKKVIRTKNLYLLQLGAQLILLTDKTGFANGASCSAFEGFIRQKASRAKFRFPRADARKGMTRPRSPVRRHIAHYLKRNLILRRLRGADCRALCRCRHRFKSNPPTSGLHRA
jgi:hypothetical protein